MTIAAKKLIYIIAGEASGDTLGADLIKSLHQLYPKTFDFKGIGGEKMHQQGLTSLFPLTDINHMGLIEIIKHLPLLWKRFWQTVRHIKECAPAILITIDAPEFTLRVGKRVRSAALPHIHYVAPTVWAWRPGRAKKIARKIDHLLVLYDFEPPYFLKENLETTFVGHPLGEKIQPFSENSLQKNYIALLPGSRVGEITALLPIFLQSIQQLHQEFPTLKYWLPTLKSCETLVQEIIAHYQLSNQINVITDEGEKNNYFSLSRAAVAASGTVTLELGLLGIPTVITYKVHPLSALLGRWLIKTPYIGLPNIILQQPLMPELIQGNCTSSLIIANLKKFIKEESWQRTFQQKGALLLSHLKSGEKPGHIAANIIFKKIYKE